MTTVTTIPVGSTGELLEGLLIGNAIRESVVPADPSDPNGWAAITSTAPTAGTPLYGYNVWVQGGTLSTSANVSVTVNVTSTVGVITSSVPMWVSQSTTPWVVSSGPTFLSGTSQVNIVSSVALNVNATFAGTADVFTVS